MSNIAILSFFVKRSEASGFIQPGTELLYVSVYNY